MYAFSPSGLTFKTSSEANPSLVPTFVEEACRFDPPFRGHYRVATQDVELDGKSIPAGSHLILMWPAANRDSTAYDDPDEVRLDRPNPRHHVGFGWGIHLCVGAPLARVEAKVAIERLLARTRAFRLDALGASAALPPQLDDPPTGLASPCPRAGS